MKTYPCLLKRLFVGVASIFLIGFTLNAQVSNSERDALIALYNSTGGGSWTNNTNWATTNPVSTWYGVTVSGNNVTQLNLRQNNLDGSLPSELFNLTNLTFLHLRGNLLDGSISPLIGNLTSLTFLGLNENQFSGDLPTELGNLTNLRELYLQDNGFTGSAPASMTSLVNLGYLFLFDNELEGLPTFSALTQLVELRVQNNKLQFDVLENNNGIASNVYTYSPQTFSGSSSSRDEHEGTNVTLTAAIGGTNNTYQWYKDGLTLVSETSKDLNFSSIQESDAGVYTCIVANTIITGFTLTQAPITLTIITEGVFLLEAEDIGSTNVDLTYLVQVPYVSAHSIILGLSQDLLDPSGAGLGTGAISIGSTNENNGTFTLNFSSLSPNTLHYAVAVYVDVSSYTPVLSSSNIISFTTKPEGYDELYNLYQNAGGDNWTNNSGWLIGTDFSTWHGITMSGGDITKIELNNNNLVGDISNLSSLSYLTHVDVGDNSLQFAGFQSSASKISALGSNFTYTPQTDLGGGGTFDILQGEDVDVSIVVSGSGNVYDWEEDTGSGWGSTGISTASHTFNPVDDVDYRLKVTNSAAPSLVLYSKIYEVNVRSDRDILMEFYLHNDGPNWNSDANWNTTQHLSIWYGITTNPSGKVTSIQLPSNNLTGTLFPALSELSELVELKLGGSNINLSGSLPEEWGNMSNLVVLDLSYNNLEGTIPESWSQLTSLTNINLGNNNLSGAIPDEIANLPNILRIEIHNNHFDYLPNFGPILNLNNIPGIQSAAFDVDNNNLEFDDLQRQIPDLDILSYYYYSDQAKINEEETITGLDGRQVELSCTTPGTGLIYQWYIQSGVLNPSSEYTGETSSTLTILDMGSNNADDYYCIVTNNNLPALALMRETIHLLYSTFDLNALLPFWYITTATVSNDMHNKIVVPALADESGLTTINVYGYNQNDGDYTDLLSSLPLTGSATGYEYIDTNSDPNVRAYGYKISVVDDLTNESDKSDFQRSVHLSINLGLNNVRNLSWTHYEPGSMVLSYDVLAGNTLDVSSMTSQANLPIFLNTYTDYGTWNYYIIQTNFITPPMPLKNGFGEVYSSMSNLLSTKALPEAPSMNDIWIYPNPVGDIATLTFENPDNLNYTLNVCNINGQEVKRIENITTNQYSLAVNDLPKGLYIIRLVGEHVILGKMIVE